MRLALPGVRGKLLAGAGVLALVPVALTALLVGYGAFDAAGANIEKMGQEALVSIREAKRQQIEDYLSGQVATVQALARSSLLVAAAGTMRKGFATLAADTDARNPQRAARMRTALGEFYGRTFTDEFGKRNVDRAPDLMGILNALDPAALAAQHVFIAENPHPLGQKDRLVAPADKSAFAAAHAQIHPTLETFQKKFGFYDIFIIDHETGSIVYTVAKEIDFGTNLVNGPYAQTGLGEVFRKVANTQNPNAFALSDYATYLPSFNDEAAFLAVPILDGGVQVGVMAIQLPIDRITSIMTSDRKWKSVGLGDTGEVYLLGADQVMRSDSRFIVEGDKAVVEALRGVLSAEQFARMTRKNTTIGILKVDTEASRAALRGETGFVRTPDYRRQPVYSAYAPLKVAGLNWAILAEVDQEEALAPRRAVLLRTALAGGLVALLVIAVAAAVVTVFVRRFMAPVDQLQATVAKLAEGDLTARARVQSGDELQQLGDALDALVEDKIETMAKAQEENEQLNTSVVSLLQSVFQISQRDLTVRALVTPDIVGPVADSVNQLTEETSRVLAQVTRIAGTVGIASRTVAEQADVVSRTAADERTALQAMIGSLAQTTVTLNRVAEVAARSNQSAEEATAATNRALSTVNETVVGMDGIREAISDTEKRIKRLAESSQEITGIVNLINTISERTHMLALNASMQAAMAGESGKGFAVVAEEVQRLSESTRAAASQISDLVLNIQGETGATIANMNRTIGQVVAGSERAQRAGADMRDTQVQTAQLVEQVRQIAAASQDQLKVAAELRQRVAQIGRGAQLTEKRVAEQLNEARVLAEHARELVDSVAVFKLPEAA